MKKFTAKSPWEWVDMLEGIASYMKENIDEIEEITIRNKCLNCYKNTKKTKVVFKENQLIIKDWCFNCNSGESHEHEFAIKPFHKDKLFIHVDKLNQYHYSLNMEYNMGIYLTIPLTDTFDKEDYEIHGQKAYKDRNLKFKQRETEDGIVLMLQNFIDFRGLSPMYNNTIYIKFKEYVDEEE